MADHRKALGGGLMPVSAFLARRSLMDVSVREPTVDLGGKRSRRSRTRGDRAVREENRPSAAASSAICCFRSCARSNHPAIIDGRGKGLWAGVELDAAYQARDLCLAMMRAASRQGDSTRACFGWLRRLSLRRVI